MTTFEDITRIIFIISSCLHQFHLRQRNLISSPLSNTLTKDGDDFVIDGLVGGDAPKPSQVNITRGDQDVTERSLPPLPPHRILSLCQCVD